jgi:hypothetical protein
MTFSPEVYERIREGCQRSAEAVVPRLYELILPKTVADIGGGEGWWGRAFFDRGCDVLIADDSIDVWKFEAFGSPDPHRIDFLPVDLRSRSWASRVVDERAEIAHIHGGSPTFDLAVCLEVAEHLPAELADDLVAGLCAVSRRIVFSAAIPGQGGHGHLNEQWPAYWAEKFETFGLYAHDFIRSEFWNDELVEPWYRQNLLFFTDIQASTGYAEIPSPDGLPLSLVHPDIYQWRIAERDDLRRRA